ncbi:MULTISPECIES: hypothetical protein [Sporomusa]|uniref:hypothetical protein n=1 Tax=Sporomusa TaxID=2375 RepID=UPI00202E1C66|nr:hypothetical protein [Sporomusa sphaeroides]MCM0760542.1 hypothetical protein [Sporomusa sphaeroides DSM 2875]
MTKQILLFALCLLLLAAVPVQAEEPPANSPLDWELSVRPKPSEAEIERQRWVQVFKNDIGIFAFDHTSLKVDEADNNLVHVLTKTIFTDPKLIGNLHDKYQEKLTAEDKVAYSEIWMAFKTRDKTYAVTGIKVVSEQGTVLEERQQTAKFAPVPVKTFADSMYEIVKNYVRNN